eukprot:TRINITY_DN5094_c0_g2_i6.p1 TRINITY_DN5094_c0_g2~~TRINITY_DN5094_c0_g2_i6.p1  ORF type:complete len:131 (+),score=17.02 TRINITY_DN5094_c0_g2_i6:312-704(+)
MSFDQQPSNLADSLLKSFSHFSTRNRSVSKQSIYSNTALAFYSVKHKGSPSRRRAMTGILSNNRCNSHTRPLRKALTHILPEAAKKPYFVVKTVQIHKIKKKIATRNLTTIRNAGTQLDFGYIRNEDMMP